jgi:hypothetical protein
MGIFDWFQRKPPISDRAALVEFLDSRAAFLAQKTIFDYVRALSGPFFSQLIKESAFHTAVENARWHNYPIGLSMVAETIHVSMRRAVGQPQPLADALAETSLDAFDRYPVPPNIGSDRWMESRATLTARVKGVGLHPAKRIMDIANERLTEQVFSAMPVHDQIRGAEAPVIKNLLSVNLIRMYEDFSARADMPGLIAGLGLQDAESEARVL